MSNTREVLYVEPGGCFFNDNFVQCELMPSECSNSQINDNAGTWTFKSATEMKFDGSTECEGIDKTYGTKVGMCAAETDVNTCTSDATNCDDPSQFIAENDFCTVQYNIHPASFSPYTHYGSCKVKGRGGAKFCSWSKADCPGDENTHVWTEATAQIFSGKDINEQCTCDKVVTGACYDSSNDSYSCAVDATSCDASATTVSFINATTIFFDETHPLCYLCPEFHKVNPIATTAAPSPAPTPAPAAAQPQPCPAVPEGGCSICGDSKCVSNHDAIIAFEGQPQATCGQLQVAGYTGVITPNQCAPLPELLETPCACVPATQIMPNAHTLAPGAPTLIQQEAPNLLFQPTPRPAFPDSKPIIEPETASSSSSNTGPAVGGSIGALLAVGIGLALVFYCRRQKSGKDENFQGGDVGVTEPVITTTDTTPAVETNNQAEMDGEDATTTVEIL